MIQIQDKRDCCGCAACVQVCPRQCIDFEEDEQGFRYPLVDTSLCIDCGLCDRVCPVSNPAPERKPLQVYAAKYDREAIRLQSSSGGIFTRLAEAVIDQGGVVFGASFDSCWEVEHTYTETKEGLAAFRGSKYLQSRIGETFQQVLAFLKAGRKVLYSGTSCQIAGLKKFLRKDYENLLTIDVVCHGVPSPLVWRTYLKELQANPMSPLGKVSVASLSKEVPVITDISFRDKSTGWKRFSLCIKGRAVSQRGSRTVCHSVYEDGPKEEVLIHEALDQNFYMKLFLNNLSLRPACFRCSAKSGKCGSDFTLADFWGIGTQAPQWDDDKGTSLVMIQSERGLHFFNSLSSITYEAQSYEVALSHNPSIEHSVEETRKVKRFWKIFHQAKYTDLLPLLQPTLLSVVKGKIKAFLFRFV